MAKDGWENHRLTMEVKLQLGKFIAVDGNIIQFPGTSQLSLIQRLQRLQELRSMLGLERGKPTKRAAEPAKWKVYVGKAGKN